MVKKAITISSFSSNSGKTVLTTALLYHFRGKSRGFKIGPDFIDPQFHKFISGIDSINLDSFIMNKEQLRWIFNKYNDKEIAIIEGVMGFYDGEDRGCSSYSVSKDLGSPVIMVIDCSGSYITVSALLKGVLEYKKDNSIKGVVLNRISSENHFKLIKNILEIEHKSIKVLGWIRKDLESLSNTHLGLDLKDLKKIKKISKDVLENIDIDSLIEISCLNEIDSFDNTKEYPFPEYKKINRKIAVVNDKNFSFLYYDNLEFFREVFDEVVLINSNRDESIPQDTDIVYIPGGYVESEFHYSKIKNSNKFKSSLIKHSEKKAIYGECAGLLYLSKRVDNKNMSGILDIEFNLQKRFVRLGYFYNQSGVRGHSFHYTKPTQDSLKKGFDFLSKTLNSSGEVGSWKKKKVFGTFLHTFFRVYPNLIIDLI